MVWSREVHISGRLRQWVGRRTSNEQNCLFPFAMRSALAVAVAVAVAATVAVGRPLGVNSACELLLVARHMCRTLYGVASPSSGTK